MESQAINNCFYVAVTGANPGDWLESSIIQCRTFVLLCLGSARRRCHGLRVVAARLSSGLSSGGVASALSKRRIEVDGSQ